MSGLLTGVRVFLLEDEFLIAIDVEQICLDHGAQAVLIARNLREAEHLFEQGGFDAAIIDLSVDGQSTVDFAARLRDSGAPFVFASGYTQREDLMQDFPGVPLVSKPFAGEQLVRTLAEVYQKAGPRAPG